MSTASINLPLNGSQFNLFYFTVSSDLGKSSNSVSLLFGFFLSFRHLDQKKGLKTNSYFA